MRKIVSLVLALALLLTVGVSNAWAAERCVTKSWDSGDSAGGICGTCAGECAHVDADDDGRCDHCQSICPDCPDGKDENGDQRCDSCGKHAHLADDNADGLHDQHEVCTEKEKPSGRECHTTTSHRSGHNKRHH